MLLKTGKKIVLNKGVYTDKELNTLIGMKAEITNAGFPRRCTEN